MARKPLWTLASTLVSACTGSTSGPSNVARSSVFNRPASHAASVVPATIGGLSDTPVAPSITHALTLVAPMASSLTKALGDECEKRSIILNTTFCSNSTDLGRRGNRSGRANCNLRPPRLSPKAAAVPLARDVDELAAYVKPNTNDQRGENTLHWSPFRLLNSVLETGVRGIADDWGPFGFALDFDYTPSRRSG